MEPTKYEACVALTEDGYNLPPEEVEARLYQTMGRTLADVLRAAKGERFVVCGTRHSVRGRASAWGSESSPSGYYPPSTVTNELLTLEVGRVVERYPVHANFAPPLVRDMDWPELRRTAWQEIGRRWAAWCRRWWRIINLQEEP